VREPTPLGPGRVLVLLYATFVVAAGARSAVQLATHASRAPLAYGLSALSALVYLAGALLLARVNATPALRARRAARLSCLVELVGVVVVGTIDIARPQAFAEATVWSGYGRGYGFVPLVLPVLALLWLARAREASAPSRVAAAPR
jgi:cytochrome bd-type quinol oxidase subunit 2